MKTTCLLTALLFAGTSAHAYILIDDSDAQFAATGDASSPTTFENNTYTGATATTSTGINVNTASVFTYNLGAAPGFSNGTYGVYVQYQVGTGAHTTSANYAINGSSVTNLNQRQLANQGAPSASPTNGGGSGYHYLGEFSLNGSSQLVVTNNTSGSDSRITADSVMLRTAADGRWIDPFSASVSLVDSPNSNTYNVGESTVPGAPSGNFGQLISNDFFRIADLALTNGTYDLTLNYYADTTFNDDVDVILDLDGDWSTSGDKTYIYGDGIAGGANGLNQRLLGDQSTVVTGLEYTSVVLGSYAITTDSALFLRSPSTGPATENISLSGVVSAIPEPATAATLVGALALGIAALRRRKNR